jgi:hypothetical protein
VSSHGGDVTHIHDRSLFWLGTGISIKGGDVTHIHDKIQAILIKGIQHNAYSWLCQYEMIVTSPLLIEVPVPSQDSERHE